jgi:hypothetical protein
MSNHTKSHLAINPTYTAVSSWWQHVPLAFWLIEKTKPAVVVELGTHYGVSFFAFCQAAQLFSPSTHLYAVDTWQGDTQAGLYDEHVFETVQQHANQHYKSSTTLMRSTFEAASHQFSDASIDLLHIDGFHSLEAVQTDYNTWLSKMKPTGIILFHDIVVQSDGFGVWQFWDKLKNEFPNCTLQDDVWPGLGILFLNGIPETIRLDWEQNYPIIASKGMLLANIDKKTRELEAASSLLELKQVEIDYISRQLERKKSELSIIKTRIHRFSVLRILYRLVKYLEK